MSRPNRKPGNGTDAPILNAIKSWRPGWERYVVGYQSDSTQPWTPIEKDSIQNAKKEYARKRVTLCQRNVGNGYALLAVPAV